MNLAERVHALFLDCLFRDGENFDNHVAVEGITANFGLHPDRLAGHRAEIAECLRELPDTFHVQKGGGHSFLNACVDRHGNHWAEHPTMQELFVLALGTKQAQYCLPRDLWEVLPGGMPYLSINPDL